MQRVVVLKSVPKSLEYVMVLACFLRSVFYEKRDSVLGWAQERKGIQLSLKNYFKGCERYFKFFLRYAARKTIVRISHLSFYCILEKI